VFHLDVRVSCSDQQQITSTYILSAHIANMSDVEMSDDEVGESGKAVDQSMVFSAMGAEAKGKRSAANLPVELEDSLPWYASTLD